MHSPTEIIPVTGRVSTPREASRPASDHIALIRSVLRRVHAQAWRDHAEQRADFSQVEGVEAALASLQHLERGQR